jgi:hypothetical protein
VGSNVPATITRKGKRRSPGIKGKVLLSQFYFRDQNAAATLCFRASVFFKDVHVHSLVLLTEFKK